MRAREIQGYQIARIHRLTQRMRPGERLETIMGIPHIVSDKAHYRRAVIRGLKWALVVAVIIAALI